MTRCTNIWCGQDTDKDGALARVAPRPSSQDGDFIRERTHGDRAYDNALARLIHRRSGIRWRICVSACSAAEIWVSTPTSVESDAATPAMVEDILLPFSLPSVRRKKITAAFDGGRMTSDGGVMLLAAIENSFGIATKLASVIADPRNPALVSHSVADIMRARMLAIASGYEDADDLDHLRTDPGFKLACGRLPDSGRDLCSQPTVSRLENTPDLRQVIRLTYALVDFYCASYSRPPGAATLDIDDTVDVVHGHQQLSLFNAHYDD